MEEVTVEVEPQTQQPPGNGSLIIFKKAISPVTLKFEDVDYKIKSKTRGFLKKSKSEEKTILNGATGMVLPGEILAMLGPSGSGITTLLTALGGRLDGHLEGNITYNGKPFSSTMKRNIGFVTQDDVMYPHLTVTETLVYTALLRLPNSLCKKEKMIITEAVITQLGLSHCRDSIVGNPFMRGVSGGERKRVSIGQEVIINPSILLLDEPTSGLDSTTAQRIVSTLWELANGGRTIVMTIHQPSSRLFYMFHKVLLLSEGNPLYYGKGSNAMDYFLGIQFAPTVAMNPSDFLLDLANGVFTDDSQEDQASIKHIFVSAYKANLAQSVKAELECDGHFHGGTEDKNVKQWPSSWWEQFSVLFRRGLKERKHESLSGLKIVEILAVIVITGLLWWQSDISHLRDQVGLLFFYSEFWGYVPLFDAILTFPQERMMLEKERSSGMYRLSSYFMARTLGDLPMELIFPTTFFSVTYWMAGLKPAPGNFFSGLIINLFNVLVSQGLGLAIGAAIMDQEPAITIGTVIVMLFLLSSGYFVQHVPKYISWIKYLSITQYTYKLLLGSQYKPGET